MVCKANILCCYEKLEEYWHLVLPRQIQSTQRNAFTQKSVVYEKLFGQSYQFLCLIICFLC